MKSCVSFFSYQIISFFCRTRQAKCLPNKGATGEIQIMIDVSSGCSKKIAGDTRNNWVTMLFVTKNRYNCFKKQQHITTCTQAFHRMERFGYAFGDFGFAWNHVHFQVNIPKHYSIQTAEIMMKSYTSRCMFETHQGFRRRYPRGSFWSGYEHHQSTGLTNLEESSNYLRDQLQHHNIIIVDDRQQKLVSAE